MIICKPCLERHFTNISMFLSFGICENCEKHAMCNNIPAVDLLFKAGGPDTAKLLVLVINKKVEEAHGVSGVLEQKEQKPAKFIWDYSIVGAIDKEKYEEDQRKRSQGMKISGLDDFIEKDKKRIEFENTRQALKDWEKSMEGLKGQLKKELEKAKEMYWEAANEISNNLKTKPMISNEDYSKEKSPWNWLWFGDKSFFLIGWIIFTTIFTVGVWEYGWKTVFWVQATIGSIGLFLIGYRVWDYIKLVRNMDILSFSAYKRYKKTH